MIDRVSVNDELWDVDHVFLLGLNMFLIYPALTGSHTNNLPLQKTVFSGP